MKKGSGVLWAREDDKARKIAVAVRNFSTRVLGGVEAEAIVAAG